jgi:hypothetical protein
MDTVGTFTEAVGKDIFRPYNEPLMKQAFQGIELGSARLRESSFLFFGVMAGVFGEEFAPSLPAVVPSLIASLKQEVSGQESPSPTDKVLVTLPKWGTALTTTTLKHPGGYPDPQNDGDL